MDAQGNSEAIASTAAQLKRGDGASEEDFTLIGEITSIPLPKLDSDEIEVTHLNSPEGYKEFIRGFKDSGVLEVPMNFVRADYETMFDDYNAGDDHNYQIVLPDTDETTLEFTGYVKGLGGEAPTGDKISATVTIRISGAVSLAS